MLSRHVCRVVEELDPPLQEVVAERPDADQCFLVYVVVRDALSAQTFFQIKTVVFEKSSAMQWTLRHICRVI